MQTSTAEPMEPSEQFCPNSTCCARGQIGQGTIAIHDRKRQRYRCTICKHTDHVLVAAPRLRDCAPQRSWWSLSSRSWPLDARCKRLCRPMAWMGLSMMVSTRLWLGGVVSGTRDTSLADRLLQQVRACSQTACARLFCTDGWAAYPNSIRRAFRDKVKRTAGRGRAALQIWSGLHIGTVIKHTVNKRLREVVRQMSHGTVEQAMHLLQRSAGGQVLNTSYIERFNGTVRERLATLTRKCRHAAQRLQALETGMYLIGSTYNFCCFHQALNKRVAGEVHTLLRQTPAMARGLTDHLWSISELLRYKVAPAPWVEPKRRGRPRRHPVAEPSLPKRPRGRPRIRPLPDPNVPKRPRGRPRKIPLSTFTG